MIFLDDRLSQNRAVLEGVNNDLQNHVSKIASRRLHLQSLIAKRDRLDYEILQLKRRIKEDRKAKTRTGKTVKEQAICLLESLDQMDNILKSSFFTSELKEVRANLALLKDEEDLIDILEGLPRLSE